MKETNYLKSIEITGKLCDKIPFLIRSDPVTFTWRREFRGPRLLSKIAGIFLVKPPVAMGGHILEGDAKTLSFKATSTGVPLNITEGDRTAVPQYAKLLTDSRSAPFRLDSVSFRKARYTQGRGLGILEVRLRTVNCKCVMISPNASNR